MRTRAFTAPAVVSLPVVLTFLAAPGAAAPFLRIEGENYDVKAPKCSSDIFDGIR